MKSAIRVNAGLLFWFAKKIQACEGIENVTLQNITIPSGQRRDYCARSSITVAGPDQNNNSTFFVVEPNGTARFNAGYTIILRQGFHAMNGSNIIASVIPFDGTEPLDNLQITSLNKETSHKKIII